MLIFVLRHQSLAGRGGRKEGGREEGRKEEVSEWQTEAVVIGKTFVAKGNPERTNEEIIVYAVLGATKVLQKKS